MSYVPRPRNKPDLTPRQPTELLTESLLIRLTESVGKLPAGFVYELPAFEGVRLVHRRLATVVGSVGVLPDLTLTEDECFEAGL